jgi:SWI/SNF-related matrix-associated actin-dependent regulator 1 of chromatin subfamily A
MNNINDLNQEIEDTRKLLAELEEKRRLLPTQALIHSFVVSSGKIRVKLSKMDDTLVDILRRIPARAYLSTDKDNLIPATELEKLLNNFNQTPIPPTINWDNGTKEAYDAWINQADIKLSLNEKKSTVLVELGPRMLNQRLYIGYDITSWSYNSLHQTYSFSLAEAYKWPPLVEKHYPEKTVEYSDGLLDIIMEQANRSKLLMEVANANDAPDIINPFTGINPITGEKFDLKPLQRTAVKFAQLTDYKALIAYDMGGGKTPIGMACAEIGGFKKILIICPATMKTNWRMEIKKFLGQDAFILSGSSPDNAQLDAIYKSTNYKYFIINYDILSRSEITETAENGKEESINKWAMVINFAGFDLFLVDESHRIKNMDSKRSKAVRALVMPHVLPLSGTPIVNRPSELFPSLNIIDRQNFNNFSAFAAQFMDSSGNARNVKQLHGILANHMIRKTSEQINGKNLDPNRIPFTKELGLQARANYQKVLEGIYISLRRPDYQRNVTSILAELVRCKQICSADNCETSADLAIEAFEETGKKVLIFSQFLESQAAIAEFLGREAVIINGGTPQSQRDELCFYPTGSFHQSGGHKFIITNILEGLTLTPAYTTIFNDLWWTPKDHSQAEGRAFGRVNDPHGGNSYYVQNENTIDQFIVELLQKKMNTFKEVIDGVPQAQEAGKSIAAELIEHLRKSI